MNKIGSHNSKIEVERQETCLDIYRSLGSRFFAELLEAFGPDFSADLLVLQDTDFSDCLRGF